MCERIWPSSQHRRLRRGVGGGGGDEGRVSHIDRWGGSVRESSGGEGEHDPLPSSQNFQSCLINCVWRLLVKKMFIRYRWLLDWHRSTFFCVSSQKKNTLSFGHSPNWGAPLPKSILTLFDFDTFLKVKKSPKLCAGGRG